MNQPRTDGHAKLSAKGRVQSRILPAAALGPELRDEMFTLFAEYYIDVDRKMFDQDLAEKTHVFIFRDASGLIGFSTIFRKRLPEIASGLFLFSGDTVLRRDYWGSKILQMTFFRYIVQSKLLSLGRPVRWMLISKGFKTYMMMRKNFAFSFPAPDRETPADVRRIMDTFYAEKFGAAYRPERGIISFDTPHGAVKSGFADPHEAQLKEANVKHFLRLNPGWKEGVELACMAEIRVSDFLLHIPKYFLRPVRRLAELVMRPT